MTRKQACKRHCSVPIDPVGLQSSLGASVCRNELNVPHGASPWDCRCHGLAPWLFTLASTPPHYHLPMPRACPVVRHVGLYTAPPPPDATGLPRGYSRWFLLRPARLPVPKICLNLRRRQISEAANIRARLPQSFHSCPNYLLWNPLEQSPLPTIHQLRCQQCRRHSRMCSHSHMNMIRNERHLKKHKPRWALQCQPGPRHRLSFRRSEYSMTFLRRQHQMKL